MARPPAVKRTRPPVFVNAPRLALMSAASSISGELDLNEQWHRSLPKTPANYYDVNIFTSAKGKEEVLPWNGHSPKDRWPDGK